MRRRRGADRTRSRSIGRNRPLLESLESRQLLSGDVGLVGPVGGEMNFQDILPLSRIVDNDVPVQDRRFVYTTPEGSLVTLTLFGPGTLEGTSVDPDGVLHIVYNDTAENDSGTGEFSAIVGNVVRQRGPILLGSITDADVPPEALSGDGIGPVGAVNLREFDLVPGGVINFTGGIGTLLLRSAGENSQINLTSLPAPDADGDAFDPALGATLAFGAFTGVGGLNLPGAALGATPAGADADVDGIDFDVFGIDVSIPFVNGARGAGRIGDANLFGFDVESSQLIQFNAETGAVVGDPLIVPTNGGPFAGASLARVGLQQTVLVGTGTEVFAFDIDTREFLGSFDTAGVIGPDRTLTGLGGTDSRFLIVANDDPIDPDASPDASFGGIFVIDLEASLASGQAVTTNPGGLPFVPGLGVVLTGGLPGTPGSEFVFATGAARFESFTPTLAQPGLLGLQVSFDGTTISELGRTPLTLPGGLSDAADPLEFAANPELALGSFNQQLTRFFGLTEVDGRLQNNILLVDPGTATATGAFTLDFPSELEGLTEVFYPALVDSVLIDVQGTLRSFRSLESQGLVINSNGLINVVQIQEAEDVTISGRPVNHIRIPLRSDVSILSSERDDPVSDLDVIILDDPAPIGPLSLPF